MIRISLLTFLLASLFLAMPEESKPLDSLAWMTGHWSGTQDQVRMEEVWMAPEGGMMLGMHRDVFAKDRAFFEFLRIAEENGRLTYFAQPKGRSPTTQFSLKSQEEKKVVFENPAHDFPQRILYWRKGATLHARIEGTVQGEEKSQEWAWEKK